MAKTSSADEYEKVQNYNFLTRWFHSFRYKELHKVLRKYQKETGTKPLRVLEIGSAYGKLYNLLDSNYELKEYTGIELFEPLYHQSINQYGKRPNANFILGNCMDMDIWNNLPAVDIIITLETLEHIPEHEVVRLIENIRAKKPKLFICSVPVEIGPTIWLKNLGSFITGYMRHKEYTWGETFWAGLYKLDKLPPHDTGHKGFDWRWLAQTIRHNFKIKKITTFPFNWVPAGLATSVFISAKPRE